MKLSIRTKMTILFLLIIAISLVIISERGFRYVARDKDTYVQDLNNQNIFVLSNFLADRIGTLGKIIDTFSEFAGYRFKDEKTREDAQKELLNKFSDFLSVSVFKIEPPNVTETFSLYDTGRLKQAMVSKDDISNKNLLLELYGKQEIGKINLRSVIKQSSYPLVLLSLKKAQGVFVIATIPQKALMNIISTKEIYTSFITDGKGNLIIHQNPKEILTDKNLSAHPMVKDCIEDSSRMISSKTKEYYDPVKAEDMLGTYSHIGDTGLCLVVQIPKKMAYLAGQELIRNLAIWVVMIFILAVIITFIFSSGITRPLKALTNFASKVGRGDFSAEVPKKTNDELGELVGAFNKMNVELKERDVKLEESHKQLVQSEKMSAFGQMSAGIAHEVKNPLAGILGYAQIAKKKTPPESGIINYLEIIEKETKRCKDIVENLMRFARQEKAAFEDIFISKALRDAVALVDHQITISGIKIERIFPEAGEGIKIFGNTNQLTQVFTNIMLNAQYAMKKKGEGGTLTAELIPGADKVQVVLSDTGIGIPKENIPKLFEPFFTTKPEGEGTGLGLSVTYGIVKDHKAEVKVESEVGKWTKFIVTFPVKKS